MSLIRRVQPLTLTAGLLVALIAIAEPCSAEWRRIDSPNFVVVGDVSARTLRDVAVRFEGFRETLTRVLTERATATPVPTVVIVFPSDGAFTPFKPTFQGKPVAISGLFLRGQDANYIAMVADGNRDGLRVVFHEYTHLVVSNLMGNVPAWLSEGLAEFYSTYEVTAGGREATLGRPVAQHIQRLQDTRLLKLDDLLNVDRESPLYNEGDRRSVFYAQSWALTHRILMGSPKLTSELSAFLQRVSEGTPPMQAWQQTFGAAEMERQLYDYVRNRLFNGIQFKFPDKLAEFDTAATIVSPADAEAFLAEFLVHQQRDDEAAARLSAAAKLGPENVRVKLVSALLDIARADHDSAGKRLLTIGDADDWLVAYSAAMAIAEVVEGSGETPSTEQIEAARRLAGLARRDRMEMPNAVARLAMLDLRSADGPTTETRAAIERARVMASGREDYAFVHAQILARLSDFAAARNIVGPLIAGAEGAENRESARELMRYIVRLETGDRLPGAGATRSAAPFQASPSTFVPIFRTLQAGEQRTEGMLERIDCGTGGAAVFHVRTTGGPFSAAASRMSDVEFIVYRADLSGSVPCGPMKTPMFVYLTWRAQGEKPAGNVAVAIEFLPE